MARYILKSSGQREPFSSKKFKRSLRKAGVPKKIIEQITHEILEAPELNTTKKIYNYAYSKLKGISRPSAARYSLKHALYELGPDGFFFERFVALIFTEQGYHTELDLVVPGKCVDHEIDIIMQRKKERLMVECKFHNRPGRKTDVVVTMYIKARYEDLSAQWAQQKNNPLECDGVWLVTNTQFTSEATKYGSCAGVKMLGWNYPENAGIAYLIDTLGLHPITSLTCLTKKQKRKFLAHNVLLCRDLLKRPDLLTISNVPLMTQKKVANECKALCRED